MAHICPACEQGRLENRTGNQTIEYGEVSLFVEGIQFAECTVCGEEVVLPAHAKHNSLLYADAKKSVDGMLACSEIKSLRDKWSLSQHDAASIFGGGKNAFSKYERGEIIHSKSMDLLMRVFDEIDGARTFLADRAGISLVDEGWETIAAVEPVRSQQREMSACTVFDFVDFANARAGRGDWSPANETWRVEEQSYRERA
ncbi:type II toxin-antitoxin system MqsA family antitoxin [Xanthomonas campestris]|uniref:type II toxin-antitoxin system MqsA family antitoxin n=1 Tax=Xanthomonas campestris TaxID=339 RepID=UPI002B23B51D|nr:type II toxin-antitoxin system MqsA family antitoxin [Xanthomonas campestris]MEA9657855.1 type II toxin-antitoxin system MqsA family antitoxin [Xanthomonas campestris pv. raphani]MEB1134458.1 type II toxin-antitoxin system MqsA family antitoxin [Xanthomonas campestris pv. campestris]MEB2040841.1 type II toxin-antitoxin system MqsA family antitoxin [Xanthomonas campestris pv. campestris]